MRNRLTKLIDQQGKVVSKLRLDLLRGDNSTNYDLLSVTLEFRDGLTLVVACWGDGGFVVRTDAGDDFDAPPGMSLHLISLRPLAGAVLEHVVLERDKLSLTFGTKTLTLVNDADSLVLGRVEFDPEVDEEESRILSSLQPIPG